MTQIHIFRDTTEILVKEVAIAMRVYKGRGTDELFVKFAGETIYEIEGTRIFTTSQEYPMLCHVWLYLAGDAELVMLGPQWQLYVDDEKLPQGSYFKVKIAGRQIAFSYQAYRFVSHLPGTPKGTIAEIAQGCQPVSQDVIDNLLS